MYYRLPAEPSELMTGILHIVQAAAKDLEQATMDRRRLTEHLKTKHKNACRNINLNS